MTHWLNENEVMVKPVIRNTAKTILNQTGNTVNKD